MEGERQYALISYHIFSISITVALLVKVFTSACTFSAEVFIVLILFWGGYNIVQIPVMNAISMSGSTFLDNMFSRSRERSDRKLKWSMQLLNFIMSPATVWFWARFAAAEDADLASTPDGTSLFFSARIYGGGLKPFSIFMATASAFNFLWLIYVFMDPMAAVVEGGTGDLPSKLFGIAQLLVWAICSYLSTRVQLVIEPLVIGVLYPFVWVSDVIRVGLGRLVKAEHQTANPLMPTLESQKDGRSGEVPDLFVSELIRHVQILSIRATSFH